MIVSPWSNGPRSNGPLVLGTRRPFWSRSTAGISSEAALVGGLLAHRRPSRLCDGGQGNGDGLDLVMKISRRLSRALMAGAVICSPSLAFAQDTVLFFGGVQSCAVWQSSPRNQLAGQTWILGFFSGHNYAQAQRIGRSTNASGIIDEVKKICTAQPTMRLREATKEAHGNIWDREAKSRERK